jgi:hypothetical protein
MVKARKLHVKTLHFDPQSNWRNVSQIWGDKSNVPVKFDERLKTPASCHKSDNQISDLHYRYVKVKSCLTWSLDGQSQKTSRQNLAFRSSK